ncbi:VWA domain-containing protein [Siminovitchia fortis]|uniref:VWA domain-containing protein n=2 Tax=Bacillales TaxID=1385 RepID=A0A443J2A5_9BACI|nr:VWA domain-containing protein [Siminovitchia fortis]RWR14550.1 VWA domain-containing protein [Siminovitchia fortis]WHY83590.1 VWA domain-containing protein [Siminovitchia fortis]
MLRKWLLLYTMIILVGGCSGKKVEDETKPAARPDSSESSLAEEEKPGEGENRKASEMDLSELERIKIPETKEELAAQPGGILTNDIPFEEETNMWPKIGLGDYKEELLDKLGEVTGTVQDPETIFKAMQYYIGSSAFGRAIKELEDYKMDWYEPYLPEPEELESHKGQGDPGKVLILLDASSSMLLDIEGKQKMDVAKSAATRFANTIGGTHDVSLIVYGHAGTQNDEDKELSCTTIDEVYPLQPFDPKKFTEAVDGVEAKGWTPIANAIKKARENMSGLKQPVTLYIISDGAETCNGDPSAEAKAFADEDKRRAVNIIGFDVDTSGESSLKKVAAAGNGEYISAKTIEELNGSIEKKWVPSFLEVMSKSNELIKHWGQSYDSLTAVNSLKSRIYNAGVAEKNRYYSALDSIRGEGMISPEIYEEIKKLIEKKADLSLEISKDMETKKHDELEADRQAVIHRVNEWSERMNKIRNSQK